MGDGWMSMLRWGTGVVRAVSWRCLAGADREVRPIGASGLKRKGTSWGAQVGRVGHKSNTVPTKEKGFFMHARPLRVKREKGLFLIPNTGIIIVGINLL